MRIGLVHYTAPPVIGGVERVLAGQAKVLLANHHEVVVVCGNATARVEGAQIGVTQSWVESEVRSLLAGCELVLVHNLWTMPFHDQAAKTLAQLSHEMRMVNWVHDVDVTQDWFEHLQLAAVHVAISEARREMMGKQLGMDLAKVRLIPNGVDVAGILGWSQRMKHLNLLQRDLVMFHPTRVLARKNLELGVRVIDELRQRGWDAVCVVSGAVDPHRASSAQYGRLLRDLIKDHCLEREVIFLADEGEVDEAEVRSMYQLADVMWFPSRNEGFGLPLVEAALLGVPIVCSDIAPLREVAAGMNLERIVFMDLNDSVSTIADRLIELWHKECGAARERRKAAQHYEWQRIYEDYLEPLLRGG